MAGNVLTPVEGSSRSLAIEGWRGIAHSYALVNQWQLLALAHRTDVSVTVKDLPFFKTHWRSEPGLFGSEAEAVLRTFPATSLDSQPDATLRISYPYDITRAAFGKTAVFATLEQQTIRRAQLADRLAFERLQFIPPAIDFITPSNWSAEGLLKFGIPETRVKVVPHGADPRVFHPSPDVRERLRQQMRIPAGDFVFLSIGAMTENKGVDLLLRAFAAVCARFPHCRLVLKGNDPLYESRELLGKILADIPPLEREQVLKRTAYFGNSMPNAQLAQLYQMADVYVSPYRAEGFNLPVLEAAASGLPIICTAGGPTDDFVSDSFAHKIASNKVSAYQDGQEVFTLRPDFDHLIALMMEVVESSDWRKHAAAAGPVHVHERFTWDHAVEKLLRALFD